MRHSIATMTLSGALPEKLVAAAQAGFDAVEIFENDLLACRLTPREIRHMAADLGLGLDIYQPLRDFEGVDPAQFQRNLQRAERKFDLMQELGIGLLLVCSNAQPTALGDPDLIAGQLNELAGRAAKRNLRVGFEALSWGTHINRFAQAYAAIERANHQSLGLVLDSYHTLALRDDFSAIKDLPGERIFFLQLSDAPWDTTQPPLHTRPLRSFPGLGQFDMVGFVDAVLQTGYDGPLSLEIFSDEYRAAPAQLTANAGRASLIWLEEQLRQRPGRQTGQHLSVPPAVSPHARCSYLELTTDAASRSLLDKQLSALGLTSVDAPLTVKLLPSMAPGVNVQGVGVSVADPQRAKQRSEAFGYAAGADEHAGTAAPDGSVVRFMPQRDQDTLEIHGTRLESIIRAVPLGTLDSWATFYHLTLGLKPVSSLLKHDPYGVVRGRLLQGSDLAIELETSTHEWTLAAQASAEQRISRLVFAVPDLTACLHTLLAQGIETLPVPANYYDDLAARFPLEQGEVDELRRLNMLYDRQPQGEYRHACLPPFASGLCFELIERRGGYAGTDMANAYVLNAALNHWENTASSTIADSQGQ